MQVGIGHFWINILLTITRLHPRHRPRGLGSSRKWPTFVTLDKPSRVSKSTRVGGNQMRVAMFLRFVAATHEAASN